MEKKELEKGKNIQTEESQKKSRREERKRERVIGKF